jgi:hypothetical protein
MKILKTRTFEKPATPYSVRSGKNENPEVLDML